MQPGQCLADHVGAVRPAAKLLAATGIKPVFTQQRRKFALADFAFCTAVHFGLSQLW